ncbi:MAG: hypothetical protein WC648_04535 [Candidatus Paceibacterota bacterium]|jgi:hypothetical protein
MKKKAPIVPKSSKKVARSKKVVDKPSTPEVTFPQSEPVNSVIGPTAQEHNVNLIKDSKQRKGNGKSAYYTLAGVRGSVKISSTLFAGDAPETLEVNWPVAGPKAAKVKMTVEERAAAAADRKAANAAKTPMQKLADQEARIAKQAANLAARKAKLGL